MPVVQGVGYDKGRTLELSALETLYGKQFTLSTQLIKPKYLIAMLYLLSSTEKC